MHPLYALTPMTGREAAEQRTVVIGTVEMNWRLWVILIAASPFALFATMIVWTVLGQYALVMLPTVLIAAAWLFYRRSTSGLRLRTYQTILDKRRAQSGDQFFLCGQPIDTSDAQFGRLMTTAVPYGASAVATPSAAPLAPDPTSRRGRRQMRQAGEAAAAQIPTYAPFPSPAPSLSHRNE